MSLLRRNVPSTLWITLTAITLLLICAGFLMQR
jgi:hypothetical protein